MKLNDVIQQLNNNGEILILLNECPDKHVEAVYTGDLLSHVMANGKEGAVWLTVQRHMNVIAVSELIEFAAIIFVEGVIPEEDTLNKANELHIPLITSQLDAYTLSTKLSQLGI